MFLEAPVIYDTGKFPGNLPGNLREVVTARKSYREIANVSTLNKMAAGGGLFCLVRRRRSYQRRLILADIADCEVVERFRLSRARIECLANELGDELRRNTARSCPLAPEIQMNTSVVIVVVVVFK